MVRTSLIFICFLCSSSNILCRLSPEDEQCVRCICAASTACFSILECGKKGITFDYWTQAGALGGNEPRNDANTSYAECMQDESCVLDTIDSYTKNILRQINDINCDGIVDCRDYFSAHKFGMEAKDPDSVFKPAQTKRFDRCNGHGVGNLTDSGWKPRICFQVRNNFG